MIFVTTAEGVVAVDAPPTIGQNILRAIATVTTSHVTHAIYSHHHADHYVDGRVMWPAAASSLVAEPCVLVPAT